MTVIHPRRWSPPAGMAERPCGIYLLHGTGEHSGRYEHVAESLTRQGFVVGAHDHPGHGKSHGDRGKHYPPGTYATQAGIQFLEFAKETGSTPILLGHSLGGVLAAEMVLMHGLQTAGLVLSAPAFLPYVSIMNKIKLRVMSAVAPDFSVELPYDAKRLTHDAEMIEVSHADKLNHGFKSARMVTWLMRTGRELLDIAPALDTKTLLLVPEADPVVDPAGSQQFFKSAPADLVTLKVYADAYHELFNETPDIRERALSDLIEWLDMRAPFND